MSRNSLLAVLLWLFAGPALAGPLVSLVLGDLDSQTAVAAVRQLRADAGLRGVEFAVYGNTGLAEADLARLRRSRLVVVQTVGRQVALQLAPELRAVAARGGRAYAVGRTWDADFADLGLTLDEGLRAYMQAGGPDNVANLVRLALARDLRLGKRPPAPAPMPEIACFEPASGTVSADYDAFRKLYRARPGARWVGILFYRSNALSGQTATVRAIAAALARRGLNVLPVYGYPNEAAVERYFFDPDGRPRVDAVVALGLKIGTSPDRVVPVLSRLGAPVLNAIALGSQSRAEWQASPTGLDIVERAWQVAGAEFAGAVAPTVVASKERAHDPETGLDTVVETPIPERVERLAERAARWVHLRSAPAPARKVAVIYYNYPPGKENIGASYLNVLPRSLWQILERMRREGYWTGAAPADENALFETIRDQGGNIGNWAPGAIEALARAGGAVLWPVAEYRKRFDRLAPELRDAMLAAWGRPEASKVSVWRDARGVPYFLFPARRWGNLVFAPQPSRGWEQDVKKLYHDVTVPPHHQYLAFYLWLQDVAGVDAMVHVGTHATHEWHPGKEVGYTAGDPGEVFVGAVPQLYPYIMDDIGEALQAKRRGMATIVSHLTPPFDRAGLSPELKELNGLISDYAVAKGKGGLAAATLRDEIAARARRMGLLADLGLAELDDAGIEAIEHYIKEVGEKLSPFGLHTLGVAQPAERRRATAEAILAMEPDLAPAERARRTAELSELLATSAGAELDALMAGLAGRYVAAGPGNDPIRNPDALPTGRDLYGFDPSRMPSPASYAVGARLAEELLADWRRRHGTWPKRLVFNLWGVESSRHEGVMEGEIMALWGVRPVWDGRGRVAGVAAIPRAELQRPRVDVTVVPSGLYRDLFSPLMRRLDQAAQAARASPEADNPIPEHDRRTRAALVARGVAAAEAERLAAVRLFSVPSGAYGTNLDKVIPLSNTWQDERQVADVYFMRMSHPYGQGWWGGKALTPEAGGDVAPGLGVDLLKLALKDAEAAIHSRSSNLYASLDNDDFYQYLGGTAMAIRQVNGATPEVLVANMADPRAIRHETLEKYMGREMRARYLNPAWIEAMLKEGYAGARFVDKVVEHLWGWTVATPDKVDASRWQEMYETYVADRYRLGIRDKFRAAGNLLAYQAMVDRMLAAVRKGYWQADPATVAALERANREAIAEAGVACTPDTCSSPEVTAQARAQDAAAGRAAAAMPAPALVAPAPARPTAAEPGRRQAVAAPGKARVSGMEMTETTQRTGGLARPQAAGWAGALLGLAMLAGWQGRRWRARRESAET
ncbi:cobaltochelatase subunit CobN [Parasulfuritortus cantonensis]|uniref:Cobaltochelatase subunit CobN n=1 Tax=Parasulfuritortus cantonensis TaxID=2528202 RepID=A0A4V2NWW7_9PROT|nr:cobaltochelatase subunit CobN [Parasulfuritortus cantonensis]TCJ18932.1 cobaltochelatase subunit CobN [Parasulfuritortus cantonensis]